MKQIVEKRMSELQSAKERIQKSYIARLESLGREAMDRAQEGGAGLPMVGFLESHMEHLRELQAEFNRLDYARQALRDIAGSCESA